MFLGYIFSKSLKKCFKFNDNAKTWANAMHTCIMEGGVLSDSLVNNDIRNLYLPPSQENNCYYIGFQRIFGDHFYSSRGKSPDLDITFHTIHPSLLRLSFVYRLFLIKTPTLATVYLISWMKSLEKMSCRRGAKITSQ